MASPDEAVLKCLRDRERGRRNLATLAAHLGSAPFADLAFALSRWLPHTAAPDMALNNLERLLAQPAARARLALLIERDGRGLEAVLHLLATSQFFADTLTLYPEFLDTIRSPPRITPTAAELRAELRADVDAALEDAAVLRAFRRFRVRHHLRIGIHDIIRDRSLEEITRELAHLADVVLDVALDYSLRCVTHRSGVPTGPDGSPARIAVLAFGKLGGEELNYSSDIDLMFVYDHDGQTAGRRVGISNAEFYADVVRQVVRLLSTATDRGIAYRVDLRLRPEGQRGPLARSLASTLSYYDTRGRTWERQALIKLRPVAGDPSLGREFLAAIEPFVYRKYFSFSEINEVKALKRQMEQRTGRLPNGGTGDPQAAAEWVMPTDVKTGRGGIRDIEYTVQFLQLLNGGDLPAIHQRNTLRALESLEAAGCLTAHESYILADAYRFLRKTEHRLQLLFDLQTHRLPSDTDELRKLARRMGYSLRKQEPGSKRPEGIEERDAAIGSEPASDSRPLTPQKRSPLDETPDSLLNTRNLLVDPLDQFLKELHDKTALDHIILNHLLHQTFPGSEADSTPEPETDLVLHPDPDEATITVVLGRFPFRDTGKAYRNLMQLARESVPFLSDRRCRHFFASIAPRLLRAVAATPDPDEALTNLERVTASLGAKAVLWELFSANPPSLGLYVELCAGSPFLSGLLTSNPGMADELLDSLVQNRPRTADELRMELAELCSGASDPAPILHSFQDKELLRIGVADLLGMADIRQTTAALSDLADTLLDRVIELVEPDVRAKYGSPQCRYSVLGLGKLGGREIGYHSDLDLLFLYENDGTTRREHSTRPTSHADYFTDLAQRVIKALGAMGPMGRLYTVDLRLRPTGKSGSLVLPLSEFDRYFASEAAQWWERQTLSRARVVRAEPGFAAEATAHVRAAMLGKVWTQEGADEVRQMREKLEASAAPRSLKRGRGGLTDVEFLVQMFQLKYGRDYPSIFQPNVWDALDALEAERLLSVADTASLREGYSFLRSVEARLRIVTDRPLTEVPDHSEDRAKLARRLGFDSPEGFVAKLHQIRDTIRSTYLQLTASL